MSNGLEGLQAARQRYASAREQLSSSVPGGPGDTVSISEEAKAFANSPPESLAARVEMMEARSAAFASAATIVAADSMMEDVLEIGGPRVRVRDRETHQWVRRGDRAREDFMRFVSSSFAL